MKKIVKLTEKDLSRIIKRVVNEEEKNKKNMKDLSDEFLESTFRKISHIIMSPEFSVVEDILEKTVDNSGSNLGVVLEKIYSEAVSRRKRR